MLGHLPLPAKITVEALPPIDLREEFGADPDLDEVYDHLVRPDAGDPRRARRRAALPGDRMRVAESKLEISAPPALVWEYVSDPSRYLHFMSGVTRWEVVGDKRVGLGARYRMLLRVGSAEVGGLIEVVEFVPDARPRLDLDHRHRPARPLAPAPAPTTGARRVRAAALLRRGRLRHLGLAGRAASRRRPCAGTCGARCSSSSARSSTSNCGPPRPSAAARGWAPRSRDRWISGARRISSRDPDDWSTPCRRGPGWSSSPPSDR